MPRTPLMRALQQLASEHAEADERAVSVEQVRHERQLRISRRDVLKGAGALAAGLALTDPFNLAGHFAKAHAQGAPRIAIIGGGIAGLNAALTLQDAGYASTLPEAPPRLGGPMPSNKPPSANGQTSEWCGELIDPGHKTIPPL